MRLLLRVTSVVMVATAFSPLVVRADDSPPGGTFYDDDTTIHQGNIEVIAAAGITQGCNPPVNTLYCPNDPVTRGQMAAFVTRALELPPGTGDSFSDDNQSVFAADIEALAAAGITKGCNPPSNDRFCPTELVSRAQMATFLARALGREPISVADRPFTVDLVGRDHWGARAIRPGLIPHQIDTITIHHAGDLDGVTGPAQFRGWQSWHHYLGWPDLAYHFIVGRDGLVYEGRPHWAAGDTATEYDPTGHLLIVVEGNFDESTPTDQQIEALARMIAWGAAVFDVPLATLGGHRDHAATTCPGDSLYALIHDGSLRERVSEILQAGGVTLRQGH